MVPFNRVPGPGNSVFYVSGKDLRPKNVTFPDVGQSVSPTHRLYTQAENQKKSYKHQVVYEVTGLGLLLEKLSHKNSVQIY